MRKKISSNMNRQKWLFFAIFGVITLVVYVVFCVYPILQSVVESFYDWDGYISSTKNFVLFRNYIEVLADPIFWKAVKNDFLITIIKEVVIIILTIIFAVALTRFRMNTVEKNIFRFIFYIPNIISTVIIGVVWKFIFMSGQYGLMNSIIGIFQNGFDVDWLTTHPIGVIGFVASWCGVGVFMLTMIAAINQIPSDMYEAAKVDGAGEMKQLFYITMPAVWLQATFMVVTILYQSLGGNFALVNVFAPNGGINGSSMVMGLYVYLYGQDSYATVNGAVSFSYAAAIVMLIITASVSLLVKYLMNKVEETL